VEVNPSTPPGDPANRQPERVEQPDPFVGLSALARLVLLPADTPLTKADVCRLFGIVERTVQRRVNRGELPPPVPVGVERVWLAGKIIAHIAARAERLAAEQKRREARRHAS
jgi:predicted DNA-binding transcriptional regulator AlpA